MEEGKKSVEVSARSVDEAIAQGLAQLGKTEEEVEIEVLNRGSRGVLGIGAEDALIRIHYIEPAAIIEEVEVEEVEVREELPEELEEIKQAAKEVLRGLLARMEVKAQVTLSPPKGIMAEERDKPAILLDVTGDDLGILIGRRGETLNALQYITRLIVSRRTKRWINIIVDVEEYKVRRERSLKQLAWRMAERVSLSHKPIVLEAMPAYERRIIHLALSDNDSVTTRSVGEGSERKVMIIPKK
ncbi:MAG: RNA-binding cell elongation regulator Jag/EloR [Anaerolineae bacterium]